MTSFSSRHALFIALILSLLLHVALLPLGRDWLKEPPPKKKPIIVEVRPTEPAQETAIPQKSQPPQKAQRKGAVDHHVVKEQAPPGKDMEDSSPQITRPASANATPTPPKPETKQEPIPTVTVAPQQPETPQQAPQMETLPSLDQLLQTANNAAANITQRAQTKARPDVEPGNDLLLNMQEDQLFSFFSRLKKQVYAVWNYPDEALQKGQQGVALLKIVINRDGSVEDVDLLSASGFERLDREAIAAIFKAQPYGALPANYPEDQLTIRAYFEYIIGQPKPNIYQFR